MTFKKHSEMRYGENPHQKAAAYIIPGNTSSSVLNAVIHQGKKLSLNVYLGLYSYMAVQIYILVHMYQESF